MGLNKSAMSSNDELRQLTDKYLRSELNTERLSPIQWEGIMRAVENIVGEGFVPKKDVEAIKENVLRFFYFEAELGFCTIKYNERIKWYFNQYGHEIFNIKKNEE